MNSSTKIIDLESTSIHESYSFTSKEDSVVKLAKGAIISLIGAGIGRGIHTIGQIVIARLLGPKAFGLYSIGWTILRILSNLAQCGLSSGLIRYALMFKDSNPSKFKGVMLQSLGLTVLFSVVVGGILFFGAPWIASTIFRKAELEPVLRAFSIGIPLMAVLIVVVAGTQVSQRMEYAVYSRDLAQPLANLLFVVLFYLLGWQLLGVVAASILSIGIALILALYYLMMLFPELLSKKEVKPSFITKELLSFSLPLLFVNFFGNLIMWADILMIGYFSPTADVGIYRAASQISMLFVIILGAFNMIFAPMIAEVFHKRDFKTANWLFKISTKWIIYLTLPLFLVIVFAPTELMEVLFGKDYTSGTLPLVILSGAQWFNAVTGPVGYVLVMSGHQNIWFANTVLAALANIVLNIIFIPKMGIIGAAMATAVSVVLLFLLGLIEVWILLRMFPYDQRYWKVAAAAFVTVSFLFLFRQLQLSPLLTLVGVSMSSFSFLIGAFMLIGFEREEKVIAQKAYLKIVLTKSKIQKVKNDTA